MHIQSVEAKNLKGRNFRYALSPLTIIAGPNMAGKTAIVDAIRFALLGKLPEVGEKPGAAFALASGHQMTVGVTLGDYSEDGVNISRSLTQSEGSIKCVPSKADPAYTCPLLDCEAWLKQSERERIDFIFRNVTMPEDKTPAGIVAMLRRIDFGAEHSEAIEDAKHAVISDVSEILNRPEFLPDLILSAETSLAQEFTIYNRRAADSEGSVRILAELKLREGTCSATTLDEIKRDIAALEKTQQETSRAEGELRANKKYFLSAEKRRQEIADALLEEVPAEKPLAPFKSAIDIEKVRSAIRHANQTLEKYPAEDPSSVRNSYDAADREWVEAHMEMENRQSILSDKESELLDLQGLDCCPFCRSAQQGWKDIVAKSLEEQLRPLRFNLETATQDAEKKKKSQGEAHAAWRAMETRQAGRRQLLSEIDELNQKLRQYEREVDAYDRNVDHAIATRKMIVESHAKNMQSLREELVRIESVKDVSADEIERVNGDLGAINANLREARQRLLDAQSLAHDIKRQAQAAEEHEKAAARRDVIKQVKSKLTEVKGDLVTTAFKVLLDTANGIVGELLPAPLAYHDNELGMWRTSGFVSHRTFSGVERFISYVAVACALSAKSRLRVPIIDELARATEGLRERLMANLKRAVESGTLDQVIVIIPSDEPLKKDGWDVVNIH